MPREKSRYRDRDRRSSSRSSDSSYDRKKSKSKHKRRSRSRDHSESGSHRRKRSTSRSRRYKRRSYSRSLSRERYERSRRRSYSRSRRDKSLSRSSSRSRHKTSKKSKRRSPSSSSRSSSFDIERPLPPRVNLDDTDVKIEKAIKAAEAAGLTMTKIPTYEYKEIEIKEDMPTIHDRNFLAEINNDSFVQKPFVSSRKKDSKSIVIDLNSQTVKLPEGEIKQKEESIIDFDEIPNEEELREMWIKKLYQYRKKMLKGET